MIFIPFTDASSVWVVLCVEAALGTRPKGESNGDQKDDHSKDLHRVVKYFKAKIGLLNNSM